MALAQKAALDERGQKERVHRVLTGAAQQPGNPVYNKTTQRFCVVRPRAETHREGSRFESLERKHEPGYQIGVTSV